MNIHMGMLITMITVMIRYRRSLACIVLTPFPYMAGTATPGTNLNGDREPIKP
jgi:hypothetical protein